MGIVNLSNKDQTGMEACGRCAQVCLECITMCLKEPNAADRRKCIAKLFECSGICNLAFFFMAADSSHAVDVCKICAAVCEQCAAECRLFKDAPCVKCSAECKKCAQECRSVN